MNFLLSDILTDYELKLLALIQYLREETKGAEHTPTHRNREPIITLQYSYIRAVIGGSYSSIRDAIFHFCSIALLARVTDNFGECITYRYNATVYRSLIKDAKKRKCTLTTGRSKQKRETDVETVLRYMTGKAIRKAQKGR